MARSLNRATLIGNLTRDPELRYTPSGTAVCTFSVATNRQWKTESGDTKDEAEFHRIVAWDKLAEICSQLLGKGKKVFVEGRLQTRKWTGQDGQARTTTEIVITDMILLDRGGGSDVDYDSGGDEEIPDDLSEEASEPKKTVKKEEVKDESPEGDEDIPF